MLHSIVAFGCITIHLLSFLFFRFYHLLGVPYCRRYRWHFLLCVLQYNKPRLQVRIEQSQTFTCILHNHFIRINRTNVYSFGRKYREHSTLSNSLTAILITVQGNPSFPSVKKIRYNCNSKVNKYFLKVKKLIFFFRGINEQENPIYTLRYSDWKKISTLNNLTFSLLPVPPWP